MAEHTHFAEDAELVRVIRWHADWEEARIQRWRDEHPTARLSHDGIMMVERVADLRRAADRIESLCAENADMRTMLDFPETVAGYAGPEGSTCMKVIGDDEKEYFRRSWRNAITQWQWWHGRYAAATGDTRGRTQIELAEIAERRKAAADSLATGDGS